MHNAPGRVRGLTATHTCPTCHAHHLSPSPLAAVAASPASAMSSLVSSVLQEARDTYTYLRNIDRRQLAHQVLSLVLVLSTAVMIWKGLVVASGSETPVVVVLSGSMEPAIVRGDILFLWSDRRVPYAIGEIIVYQIQGRPIPIIHRILEIRTASDGRVELLTKGDHNPVEDRGLYNADSGLKKLWLYEDEIMGRAFGFLPKLGLMTIYLTEYPAIKYALIFVLGITVLVAKD